MLTWVVRRPIPGALLVALLLLPLATATPPDSETCDTHLVVENCEGTRSDDSASCTNPATNFTVCSSTQRDEEYRRVEVLGVGAEWAEVHRTTHTTFEGSDGCHHDEGQTSLVGHGHAVRTTSPVGGVWIETESYEGDIHEHGSANCPGHETTETEEETVEGHSVGVGSDVGPQPLQADLRAERSEAHIRQDHDGHTTWFNVTGVLVGASVNTLSLVAVAGVYQVDDGAGCERVGAVVFWPLPNQDVSSPCLPPLP